MTKLMKITSLAALLVLFSGCEKSLTTPNIAKTDETLEIVEDTSIKSISDITSIAFEWKKVDDPRVVGYNFYRGELLTDGRTLKLIKTVNNRYTTHYVDTGLEPNTKYLYQIASKTKDDVESRTTNAYMVQTLPRIPALSFVQAISNMPNRIKVIWRPHEDRRVEYYRIEKFNSTMNQWMALANVKGRLQVEYIDTGLNNSEACKYRVTAFTFNDVASEVSETVTATTKALPLATQEVNATTNLARKIELRWAPSPTQDVVKYQIQRSPFRLFGYTKFIDVDNNVFNIIDKINEDGKEYYYKVLALDKDGLLSSDKVDPTLGMTLGKPMKPTLTLAQIQDNKAILNWRANDSRAVSYNVYKKVKIDFFNTKTVKYTDIKDLRFEDRDIVSGVEYSYSVQANDENGIMSEQTDETTVILPKPKSIQ